MVSFLCCLANLKTFKVFFFFFLHYWLIHCRRFFIFALFATRSGQIMNKWWQVARRYQKQGTDIHLLGCHYICSLGMTKDSSSLSPSNGQSQWRLNTTSWAGISYKSLLWKNALKIICLKIIKFLEMEAEFVCVCV